MAATAVKIASNRANASKSTGPNDTSRTRFNGLAHGLTSKQTVVQGESQAEYDTFESRLRSELQPQTATESVLAERVIAAAWRLKRFNRVESAFFNNRIDAILEANPESDPDAALAMLFTDPAEMQRMRLFLRYQTAVQREYDQAHKQFQKAKADREAQGESMQPADSAYETEAAAEDFGFASQAEEDVLLSDGIITRPIDFQPAECRL